VRDWQSRPLDTVVLFDALRVKARDERLVKNKSVYVALALNRNGKKDVRGLWNERTERSATPRGGPGNTSPRSSFSPPASARCAVRQLAQDQIVPRAS
jgi:hypothetical protein